MWSYEDGCEDKLIGGWWVMEEKLKGFLFYFLRVGSEVSYCEYDEWIRWDFVKWRFGRVIVRKGRESWWGLLWKISGNRGWRSSRSWDVLGFCRFWEGFWILCYLLREDIGRFWVGVLCDSICILEGAFWFLLEVNDV